MKTLMPAYRIAICLQRVFCHIQESKLIRAQATFGKTYFARETSR